MQGLSCVKCSLLFISIKKGIFKLATVPNRTITRLLEGILFICGRVASFAPERSEGANDATRATNKQYA